MPSETFDLNELETALGSHGFRIRGVTGRSCVEALGLPNLRRISELLGEAANAFYAAGAESRDDLHLTSAARTCINEIVARGGSDKPTLPRLRAEFFHYGDSVVVYVGDTPSLSAGFDWVPGTVESVEKSHKAEWTSDRATRGFYWRVGAGIRCGGAGESTTIHFSTTEPRVLLLRDFVFLRMAFESDLRFLAMFVENAQRDWPPIWMIEAGHTAPIHEMPFARWLLRGSCHPDLQASLRT